MNNIIIRSTITLLDNDSVAYIRFCPTSDEKLKTPLLLSFSSYCLLGATPLRWLRSLMVKALVFGTKDCAFESHRGRRD